MASRTFDADGIAHYEMAGWRAYYDREWARLLQMTVGMCQAQFGIPFPLSLKAAYHIVRASVAWAPIDHDEVAVLDQLEKFYAIAARHSPLNFDPHRVAEWEFRYFDVHRRLAGQPEKAELLETLTQLHSAIFGISPEDARESAEWRMAAMNRVDTITSKSSTDVEGDWRRIEDELQRAYRSVARHLEAQHGTLTVAEPAESGGSADYHFITHWRVQATATEVSDVLGNAPDLVRWWPSVYLDVKELEIGDERGIGKVIDLYTKGWLPYTLRWQFRVTESNYPYGSTLVATGDFDGRGIWTFEERDGWTDITYDWKIRADKPLLKYGSFIMKPLFSANHRWAMEKGEESLKLELARRKARTPQERAAIPAPPPPTTSSPIPMLAATAAGMGIIFLGARRLARR
ncbi:MAG: SRPBCC family protein [Chloroflexia bacterium]